MRSGLPDGSSSFIIIIITTALIDVEGCEVGAPRSMMGIWYGTSLVYGMVVYGMVHRWYMIWYIVCIWYGTSLVYGMVHRWYMVWWYMCDAPNPAPEVGVERRCHASIVTL